VFSDVVYSFYYWRNPPKTAATLFFFGSCLTLTLLADMDYCMKVFWFLVINTFFLGFPVSSRQPQYRFLVSPARWMFWDIPSDRKFLTTKLEEIESYRYTNAYVYS
jgi:hypothetical protein